MPEAKFEKIVRQHLGVAIVKSLLVDWLEARLSPKYFEGGVQIHENFIFLNQKRIKRKLGLSHEYRFKVKIRRSKEV